MKEIKLSYETIVTSNMLNYYSFLHGGEAFKIMDSTAGFISRDYTKGKTVTKAVTDLIYHNSVYVDETIITTGEIIEVGKTSIKIYIENKVKERNLILASSGYFIMVSVDENFKPKIIN